MGPIDKNIRILLAFIFEGLYFTNQITGTIAIILLFIAGVFILTSFIGTCPLYLTFGISTMKNNTKNMSD